MKKRIMILSIIILCLLILICSGWIFRFQVIRSYAHLYKSEDGFRTFYFLSTRFYYSDYPDIKDDLRRDNITIEQYMEKRGWKKVDQLGGMSRFEKGSVTKSLLLEGSSQGGFNLYEE